LKVFIDPATSLLAGTQYTGSMMGAPGEIEERFLEYKDADGVKIPSKVEIYQNGQKKGAVTVTKVAVNTGVQDAAFAKP
jgi:hypothetical protein